MHMKIAIIDDDQNDREYLTTYIKNYGQNHPFPFSIDTFSSGELFLKNSIYKRKSRYGFEKEIRQILKADEKLLSKDISDHSSQSYH